jgi:hypothetical protein
MGIMKHSEILVFEKIYQGALVALILCAFLGVTGCHSKGTNSTTTTLTSQTTPTTTSDLDRDGITDAVEDELMRKFAPVVRFHKDEQYLPANVGWYLQRVRMRFEVQLGFDHQLLDKGEVNITNLISQRDHNQASGLSAKPTDFFLEQTDAGGGDELDSYREETREGTGASGWTCYAHVRPVSISTYDIQYIFFYAYNGDLLPTPAESAHEADFEHITVRVSADLKTIEKIYYAAHDDEGKWYYLSNGTGTDDGYTLTADGRPVVYSAVDSHASYPRAGQFDRGLSLPADETGEGGPVWDCINNVVNAGEKEYPRAGMEWIQYSGRWGEIGEVGFTSGPYGPAYQGWWIIDPE